ncbi:PKD-like family lipoprotein [Chitinophaga lutea]
MTLNIKTSLCFAFLLALAACRKDEGNYDYTAINELKIGGINEEYTVNFGEPVGITPDLDFTKDSTEDHFSYEWIAFDYSGGLRNTKRLLYAGKELDTTIHLNAGSYDAYYVVTEKSTGISWNKPFRLIVNGAFARRGWFVLSEVAGSARLGFWQEDMDRLGQFPIRHIDILSQITDGSTGTPLKLEGEPVFLAPLNNLISSAEPTSKAWLYIGTKNNVEKLNITNGLIWKAASYAFKYETANNYPEVPSWVFAPTSGSVWAYYGGEIFKCFSGSREMFGIPVNRLSTGEVYPVEPAMAMPNRANFAAIMFDRVNKRFVRSTGGTYMSLLPANPAGFDPNNLGMDLIWMGHSNGLGGVAVALLKKPDGTVYLARMQFTSAAAFSALSLTKVSIPEILQAEKYGLDDRFGHLLYSVGGKLYRYDLDAQTQTLVKDYGSEYKITLIRPAMNNTLAAWSVIEARPAMYNKVQLEPAVLGVAVAAYKPAQPVGSGIVDILNFNNTPATPYYTLSGFGKVVDVEYLSVN